jgi:hypothetical protein
MIYFWDTTRSDISPELKKFIEVGVDDQMRKEAHGSIGELHLGCYHVSFHKHEVEDHVALQLLPYKAYSALLSGVLFRDKR